MEDCGAETAASREVGGAMRPCAPHAVWKRLGEKWTILVLALLSTAPGARMRFSELKSGIEGVSQRMLTVTLRGLERDGLVSRHVFPEVPPRVEYEVTDVGKGVLPAMRTFALWIGENWPVIEQSQRDYDARQR